MKRKESCHKCYYWNVDDVSYLLDPHLLGRQECRKQSPVAGEEGENGYSEPVWPCTKPDDWCGDYKQRLDDQE